MTTTSTTGRATAVEVDLSGASPEPLLSIEEMEREVAAAERQRGKVARASKVRGKHFTEHVDEIQALRHAEQYDEALELLFECIAATERADEIERNGRAPAYTEWAAMTLRRQKRYGEEVAVIERFFTGQKNPARANHPKLRDRLAKARDLRDAALSTAAPLACPSCGSVLDVVPKARGKCGSCGQHILVRKIVGQTRIVTPEQADVMKAEEAALRARRKFLVRVGSWQVDEAAWDAAAVSLAELYGRPASLSDVY
ncbi:hypothetical protein C5D36_10320 [Rathayibacter sp. AY1C6]|uniref:hypothetical protein n=1 Tax=Rathayibacter sp. AY1C6 TaxID=2080539 RepID=UPI000CE858EE|nr:hypothetical protein [Rathayibacter sp. AY1C6]PPG15142.1 hypothetical protein C5D36_10320 [Rathayibacter sp. AY1C6]